MGHKRDIFKAPRGRCPEMRAGFLRHPEIPAKQGLEGYRGRGAPRR